MAIRSYLFDLTKMVEGAANSDHEKVVAYGEQLASRLVNDGEVEGARRVQEILSRSKARKFSLARAPGQSAAALPVDSESRFAVADEENWLPGQVPLILPEQQRSEIERFLKCVRSADKLVASGVGISASLLVYGPPGCGKTQLARYIASELSLPLLTARSDSLISSYLGSTAKNLRSLFDHAASRRCVLFLDEFDALAKMRDDAKELGELKRVVISLLQNIDALGPDHLLIAATNHEHLLDPAIWRRFASRLRIGEPDESGRRAMLSGFLGKFASPEQVDLFTSISEGMSGAALRQVAEDGIRDAVLDGRPSIDTAALLSAFLRRQDGQAPLHRDEQIALLRDRNPKLFTQPRLAELFGVSQPYVSKVLSGRGAKHGK